MNQIQVQAYLKRINYQGDISTTLRTLRQLQLSHLLAVPFENLDIHSNKKIELNTSRFFEKVVQNNRGGFCYELNGLFNELLLSLGFETTIISARVYSESKGHYNPEFDHLAIIVQIDDHDYLTDVGFGEFAFSPILLDLDNIHKDDRGSFKFTKEGDDHWVVNKEEALDWVSEYRFAIKERQLSDFRERCFFQQTSPESHFTQNRICSLPIPNGRKTISGNKFTFKQGSESKEIEINDDSEFKEILVKQFGMEL
ncbi:MAG: arylamine N-acetyltransferase family protein [Cyclobacteriaceae bacterium]